MTTLSTRAGKGAALTHGELDGNFPRVSQTKAGAYSVVIGDNRDTIEVTATATITLPGAAAIIASSDTGDFEVIIKNNSGTTTIGRATGGDSINGIVGDFTLTDRESVTLKVNQAGNGYNITAGSVTRDGTEKLSNKELISPVITSGAIITGNPTINGFDAIGLRMLDAPVQIDSLAISGIIDTSLQTGTVSTVTYPGAKYAILRGHILTGSGGGDAISLGSVIGGITLSTAIASAPVSNNGWGEGTVRLDASGQFYWHLSQALTQSAVIWLVGYMV